MIEKDNSNRYPLKTRDFLWFIILIQLSIHLIAHWSTYECGYNFNVFLITIYIIHFMRRVLNHLALSFRNKALTWIGYSLIIPILVWSCMAAYYMKQYSSELTDYANCASFFVTLIFVIYGFIISIYQMLKVILRPNQAHINEVDEALIRRASVN